MITADSIDDRLGTGDFANLFMDGLNLLIPQNDIYSLEPVLDMRVIDDDNGAVGEFERGGSIWIIYALSKDLTLLATRPNAYRVIILLKNLDYACGLLCEQVQPIARNQLVIHSLPSIMDSPQLPLIALARYDDQVRCMSNAKLLSGLFPIGVAEA
jgi:hypothetical protein